MSTSDNQGSSTTAIAGGLLDELEVLEPASKEVGQAVVQRGHVSSKNADEVAPFLSRTVRAQASIQPGRESGKAGVCEPCTEPWKNPESWNRLAAEARSEGSCLPSYYICVANT